MFKVGDRIRCVNNKSQEDYLKEGKIYTVKNIVPSGLGNIQVLGQWRFFRKERFVLARSSVIYKNKHKRKEIA